MYHLIIIGAGPAGLGAALYAQFYKLKTLVLAKGFCNYPENQNGVSLLTYQQLVDSFHQALAMPDNHLQFKDRQEIFAIEKNVVSFSAETKVGQVFYGKVLILAYGEGLELGLENISNKDAQGKIKVDQNQETSSQGLLAAGKAAIGEHKDVLISASEGARAAMEAAKILGKIDKLLLA